jgi:hypothetical protein
MSSDDRRVSQSDIDLYNDVYRRLFAIVDRLRAEFVGNGEQLFHFQSRFVDADPDVAADQLRMAAHVLAVAAPLGERDETDAEYDSPTPPIDDQRLLELRDQLLVELRSVLARLLESTGRDVNELMWLCRIAPGLYEESAPLEKRVTSTAVPTIALAACYTLDP